MTSVKNYMEELVMASLDRILGDLDICRCERCRMDIAAIALNNLPPYYVATEKGELYTKANTLLNQFDVDIMAAITAAAEKVRKNPRHNAII